MVVPGTEKYAVLQVGAATVDPGSPPVVGFAPRCRDGASFDAAFAVADDHRLALCGFEQPRGTAQVENLGLSAEHRRDDLGGAREPAYLAGGQLVRGSELGRAELLAQVIQGDRDDEGRGVTAMGRQSLRVDGLEQRAERLSALAVGRDPIALPRACVPWRG